MQLVFALLADKVLSQGFLERIQWQVGYYSAGFNGLGFTLFCNFQELFLGPLLKGFLGLAFSGIQFLGQFFALYLDFSFLLIVIRVADVHHRSLISSSGLHSGVGVIIVEGIELVVFLLRNGVVFVGVALSAFHGQSHPDVTSGLYPVYYVFHSKLLRDDASFVGRGMVAIKP